MQKTVIRVTEVELNNNDIKKAILNYIRDEYDLRINYEFDQLNYNIKNDS